MTFPAMRFPRPSVRALMLIVVGVAVLSLGARQYLIYRENLRLGRAYFVPINGSIDVTRPRRGEMHAGKPFRITIDYDVSLTRPKPPAGVPYPVWGEAWFEDERTRQVVDGFTFELTLATGGRESAKGSLAWEAVVAKPGRYRLHRHFWYRTPRGIWVGGNGGSTGIDIKEGP